MKDLDLQVGDVVYVIGFKHMKLERVAKVQVFSRRTKITLDGGSTWDPSGFPWARGFGSSGTRIRARNADTDLQFLRLRAERALALLEKKAEALTQEQAETVLALYASVHGKDAP